MGEFFVYILKSSVCLAFFYLFYRLLLSRETFHRFNRIALMGLLLFSVGIPFIQVITEKPVAIQRPMQNLEYLLQMAQMQTEMEMPTEQSFWLPLLFAIYLLGCMFFFICFLYSTVRICRIIRKGESQQLVEGGKLILTSQPISPFSWMGYIVVPEKDMEESGREILIHEMAHIRAYHTLDMLICSLCVVFQWFNPAAWLLKQELQNIHEFEADESVIKQGVDARNYQLLLIKKAVGSQRFTSMANSFNHSKLKKRITMMLRQKSSPWAKLRYLYVLPLTAVAVVAFARPEITRGLEKISSAKISEIVPVKEIIAPKKAEPIVIPAEHVSAPISQATPQVVKNVATSPQVSNAADSVPVVKEPVNVQEAMQKQLDNFSQSAEDRMKKVKQKVEASRKLILIDNEVSTYDQLDAISPDKIYSFSMSPKDNSQEILSKYNATDKQGVISLVTKEAIASGKVKDNGVRVVGYGSKENIDEALKIRVMQRDSAGVSIDETPLIIVDGEELIGKTIDSINPNIIESISVLKDESSSKVYGQKGKNGVILITTINKKK